MGARPARFLLLALFALAVFQPVAGVTTALVHDDNAAVRKTVRVLTYNIHHGEGMDGVFDLSRLAGIINNASPDLVAIQEVDQGTQRSDRVYQLTELGRLTRLVPTFGQAMQFQGGGYGVGILSRWTPLSVSNQPLPGSTDREPRTSLTVVVEPGSGLPRLSFTSTHLDQGRETEQRNAQAAALNDRFTGDHRVLRILAGDLNSGPESDVVQTLKTQWTEMSPADHQTLSVSGRLSFRVDYVFVQSPASWRVVDSRVIDAPIASDHRPVLAVLEFEPTDH